MSSFGEQTAVVYVASQRQYVDEALISVATVRAEVPDATVYLQVSEPALIEPHERTAFDRIVRLTNPTQSFIDKHDFLNEVTESKVVFLDGDTFVCGQLNDAFDLLDRFEVLACHAPYRRRPFSFNTGVIFCRNSHRVRSIFRTWPDFVEPSDAHDQPAFNRMLLGSDLSVFALTPEFNARLIHPLFVAGEVRILHARLPNMAEVAKRINSYLGPRIIAPEREATVSLI